MQTAPAVPDGLGNSTAGMAMQTSIDEPVLARLEALEAARARRGDRQEALNARLELGCDWEQRRRGPGVTP